MFQDAITLRRTHHRCVFFEEMDSDTDTDFEERAASCVTCIFSNDRIRASPEKIKEIEIKLRDELDEENEYQEEIIEVCNFYTWIQFELKNYKKARESNDEALSRTDWKNITSVVSRAYILWRDGDEIEAKDCLVKVEVLKRSSEGGYLMTEVEAEMAYAYSRLGGAENLTKAIEMYIDVVKKQPDKYFWKYRLGLAYRRTTHGNISLLMDSNRSFLEQAKKATSVLFDVALKSQNLRLRGRAYSQLAVLRDNADKFLRNIDFNQIFRGMDLKELINSALRYGQSDAKTLQECGRTLRFTDLGEATSLLEKSVQIKRQSLTLHHLGLCYERQAKTANRERQRNSGNQKEFPRKEVGCMTNISAKNNLDNKNKQGLNTNDPGEISYSEHDCRYDETRQCLSNLSDFRHESRTNTLGRNTPSTTERCAEFKQMPRLIRCPPKEPPLNKADPLVVKAIDCYREAIKISCGNNNPARYNLGLILRACGEAECALAEFNKIIRLTSKKRVPGSKRVKGRKLQHDYLITVTCAYEQAGLSLLELAKNAGKTTAEIQNLNEEGEKKLMKAVSLAATLSNLEPGMEIYKNHVWNAFRTLDRKYEALKDSPQAVKKYISLLMRVSEHAKLLAAIEHLRSLSEVDLSDPVVIKSGLESYLELKRYESAFAFLNFIITSQSSNDGLQKLDLTFLKVRLSTAASRLQTNEGDARMILKPLFESCMEKGITRSEDDHQMTCVCENVDVSEEVHEEDIQDVLILFDTIETDASDDLTVKVKKLQTVMSEVFGLEVSSIDERLTPGSPMLREEINQISRARVVLILLSMEPKSSYFKSLLDFIPTIIKDCLEENRPEPDILIGLLDEKTKVEQMLKMHRRISLWEHLESINDVLVDDDEEDLTEPKLPQSDAILRGPPWLPRNQRLSVGEGPQNPLRSDLVHNPERNGQGVSSGEFDDCVMAQMSLFCALIKKEWPLLTAKED